MLNKVRWLVPLTLVLMTTGGCEEDPIDFNSGDPRDLITGTWNVEEDSDLFDKKGVNGFYTVSITKDENDSTAILVSDFYEVAGKVKVIMTGRNLNIPEQELLDLTFKGYGLVSTDAKKIEWSFTVDFSTGEKDGVTATYTRPFSF